MRSIRYIFLVLILFSFIFVFWSLLPAEEISLTESIQYPQYESQIIDCNLLEQLTHKQISITYPRTIDAKSFGEIQIQILPEEEIIKPNDLLVKNCSLKVNIELNLANAEISPGQKIIFPYNGEEEMLISLEVSPENGTKEVVGNVFLSVDINPSGTSKHFLLFTAPLKIEVRNYFGFSLKSLRIIFTAGLVVFGISYLLIRDFNR